MLIAGGHVAILANRLRLLGFTGLLAGKAHSRLVGRRDGDQRAHRAVSRSAAPGSPASPRSSIRVWVSCPACCRCHTPRRACACTTASTCRFSPAASHRQRCLTLDHGSVLSLHDGPPDRLRQQLAPDPRRHARRGRSRHEPGAARAVRQWRPGAGSRRCVLASNRFPIVDPHGVTFVFRGAADACCCACGCQVCRRRSRSSVLARPISGRCRIDLPENSRVEYKFDVTRSGKSEWITDPLNPVTGDRSVRRELGMPGLRLPAAAMDAVRSARAHRSASMSSGSRARPLATAAARARLCSGALSPHAPLSAPRRARRR